MKKISKIGADFKKAKEKIDKVKSLSKIAIINLIFGGIICFFLPIIYFWAIDNAYIYQKNWNIWLKMPSYNEELFAKERQEYITFGKLYYYDQEYINKLIKEDYIHEMNKEFVKSLIYEIPKRKYREEELEIINDNLEESVFNEENYYAYIEREYGIKYLVLIIDKENTTIYRFEYLK